MFRQDRPCARKLAILVTSTTTFGLPKRASACALRILCDCLALALRGFANHLAREAEFVPPHVTALADSVKCGHQKNQGHNQIARLGGRTEEPGHPALPAALSP
jgi:hypothetical protein